MSDELNPNPELNLAASPDAEEEYEEISSEEVDRVVDALDELIATVQSENIQAFLEEASSNILALVYDDEDLDAIQDEAA
jgi:tRNA A37 threonylcarbamoyladenosine dehydratase